MKEKHLYSSLPKKIRVGYKDVEIQILSPRQASIFNAWGEYDPQEEIILIAPNLTKYDLVNTVLHEMLHAICSAFSLPKEGLEEEMGVNGIANGLSCVMRDNPNLFKWLMEASK